MEPIWTSVVAVAGTLLGAVATYPFQRLAAKQQTLRDERIAAYTAFAAAIEDFRWGQAERFFHKQRNDTAAYEKAYHEGHRLRMTARQAFYRLKLVTDDDFLVTLARTALDRTRDIHNAEQDAEARNRLNTTAKEAIEAFVDYASKHVQ
ncbi:hypothetical protein CLM62_25235 [Streptomyces sp. SA15]|nr:hypothetical protein CLM62_25235 [Streptomyces sp. SA15]